MKIARLAFTVLLCVALCMSLFSCSLPGYTFSFSRTSENSSSGSKGNTLSQINPLFEARYVISNPYEQVNWETYGQYKADFHAHSTNSDGKNTALEMLERYYSAGFSIVAMTDHDYLTTSLGSGSGSISTKRANEMVSGIGRSGLGMIGMTNSIEQSNTDHINSYFVEYNNPPDSTMTNTLAAVESLGGITHINHPGRYTGGMAGGLIGTAASNNPLVIQEYVDLFKVYHSCVGMEIVNKLDDESCCDRILWDNILSKIMPDGRSVWGFANGDSHGIDEIGYSYNIMLLPSLSLEETRLAMECGAFYAVSRVSRPDGINSILPNGDEMPGSGTSTTLYLLEQPVPGIACIVIDQRTGSITISGTDYDRIEWIADGVVIATGERLDLNKYNDVTGCYVRAQLKSNTGIAYTQPFGIKELLPTVGKTVVKQQFQNALCSLTGYQVAVLGKQSSVRQKMTCIYPLLLQQTPTALRQPLPTAPSELHKRKT